MVRNGFLSVYIIIIVAVTVALAGCAKAPQESIDAVETALAAARTAEAGEYAPDALQIAEDALGSAMTEVQAQNEKFALMRSYDAASELLVEAQGLADAAATEAAASRELAKQDTNALIDQAQTAIQTAMTALESAPRGKGTQAELDAMKLELEGLAASLETARESFANAKYLVAEAQARSVADEANAITADIELAKTKKRAT